MAIPLNSIVAQDSERTISILSFNVREWTRDTDDGSELYWRTRMEAMKRMIEDIDPDIICFQELLPPVGRYVPDSYSQVGVSISHPIYIRKQMSSSKHRFSVFWESCIVSRTVSQVNAQLTGKDVACGDWNTFLDPIKAAGLNMESARDLLGIPETDTFTNFTKPESHGAIDHFFVKGVSPLSYRMITDGYGCNRMSDHYPILLKIGL